MTIGFYDIDLHHGTGFSLSLPLMKIWNYCKQQGHQVVMMKAYEKTGRFNKIFYFKDSPRLAVPAKLIIDTEKGTMLGYGFYKNWGLENPNIIETPPSFEPYEQITVRNKSLFNSVRRNDFVDWREKDFTGTHMGAGVTYFNDRDFLDEPDWRDVFDHYDNNIEFIHAIRSDKKDELYEFLKYNYGSLTRVVIPLPDNLQELEYLFQFKGVCFDNTKMTNDDLLILGMAAKRIGAKIKLYKMISNDQFEKELIRWVTAGVQESFASYYGKDFNDTNYYKFPRRIMLKQDPTKLSYKNMSLIFDK